MIRDTVAHLKARGLEVLFDAEHFFDGYRLDSAYALAALHAADEAGADRLVLCDTNGGCLPSEIGRVVAAVVAAFPGRSIGIHAHDDCGCAVANSLAAIEAGARQIQGTLNGLGERCGNANLVTLIGALKLKERYRDRFALGVSEEQLGELTHVSRALDEMLNRAPNRHAPFVGASAFATKAGIHASAVLKDPRTYEHVMPEATGNTRKVLISDQGGKSNLVAELERIGVTASIRVVDAAQYENRIRSFDFGAMIRCSREPTWLVARHGPSARRLRWVPPGAPARRRCATRPDRLCCASSPAAFTAGLCCCP
mgnify:CR=1 FL=1